MHSKNDANGLCKTDALLAYKKQTSSLTFSFLMLRAEKKTNER